MMNPFIIDAALISAKEALKLSLVWFVLRAYLTRHGRAHLMTAFYRGVALASALILAAALIWPPSFAAKDFLAKLAGYVFFLTFLASVGALYQSTGTALLRVGALWERVAAPLLFLATIAYFSPDIAGAALSLKETGLMAESHWKVFPAAGAAFVLTLAAVVFILKRLRWDPSLYLDAAQMLLFLAVLKLVAGGTRGFAELSLIPAVQRGAMKFVHDLVHQAFVFLLVPDHPILSITTWNFIGILFGPNLGLAAALLILLLPPALFLYAIATMPLGGAAPERTGAESRLLKAAERRDRIRKAAPVALFIVIIIVFWYGARGEDITRLYNPAPKPVVADKGIIFIPLTDPTMDLRDGRLHKFSIFHEGKVVRFLVILKPGGSLAVCLDACEICPPDGYGQSEGRVTCIYCMTPIPISTLGEPGGCNPVPVAALVTDSGIRIGIDDLTLAWRKVESRIARGEGGR